MSSLTPTLLVVGLISCAVSGVLPVRTVKWIFNTFPNTFSPSTPISYTLVAQDTPQKDNEITRRHGSKQ